MRDRSVQVRGIAGASGTHAVADRPNPPEIESVRTASRRAFERGDIDPADVARIHDAFTILEWLGLEEMGFYPAGEAWQAAIADAVVFKGNVPLRSNRDVEITGPWLKQRENG